ncbi:MAG: hypothetical protein JSR45_18355 [Proteobacteria bacterium]|nr:hypothetical protein [Pseudomonadota bacterium]
MNSKQVALCGTLARGAWLSEVEYAPEDTPPPESRHLAVLAAVSKAGGRLARVEDAEAAQQSIARAWLSRTPDGGFALTILGAFIASRRPKTAA